MKYCLFIFSLVLIFSCSVQKRKYQKGYFVERHHHYKDKKINYNQKTGISKTDQSNQSKANKPLNKENEKVSADLNKTLGITQLHKKARYFSLPPDTCDVIILKDGSEISAKIEEVGIEEIKYKRCDLLSGPTYISKKSDIFMLKYSNGSKELIQSPIPIVSQNENIQTFKSNRTILKSNHPASIASLAFGILSICLGIFLLFAALSAAINGQAMISSGAIGLCFAIALIAIVFSIIALIKISKEPDIYKGRGPAITGAILATVVLFFSGLALFSRYF